MSLLQRIEHCIEAPLAGDGYAIVRVSFTSTTPRKILQIMIERLDDACVTLDDCVKAHHLVSALLDVNDFIQDRYHLEMSSAGLDRPLTKPKDFMRFLNKRIVVHTVLPVSKVKKICGEIVMANEDCVTIKPDKNVPHQTQEEIQIPFSSIRRAHLAI